MRSLEVGDKSIVIVAAMSRNRVIGDRGRIPWHLPEDFAHFRRVTTGHTLLMGRTTFDSIGAPLPGRETVVLTRDPSWTHRGVHVSHSLQEAFDTADSLPGDVVVAGGAHLYTAALPHAQMQILSHVHQTLPGDAFYPDFDEHLWLEQKRLRRRGFDIHYLHRPPDVVLQEFEFEFPPEFAGLWWDRDYRIRLNRAVNRQALESGRGTVNWSAVHEVAAYVVTQAAEHYAGRGSSSDRARSRQRIEVPHRLSARDRQAIQGALLHWRDVLTTPSS